MTSRPNRIKGKGWISNGGENKKEIRDGTNRIQFIHRHDQLLHTQTSDQNSMLPSLSSTFETPLESSTGTIDDEDGGIGLSCS